MFKKWLFTILGLWITGIIITLIITISDIDWVGVIGNFIFCIGVFLLGLSLFLNARRMADWNHQFYLNHQDSLYYKYFPYSKEYYETIGVFVTRGFGVFILLFGIFGLISVFIYIMP